MTSSPLIAPIRAEQDKILDYQWRNIDRIKTRLESPIEAEMVAIFEDQERDILAKLDTFRTGPSLGPKRVTPILTMDALFDVARWLTDTIQRLAPWFIQTIVTGFQTGALRIELEGTDFTSQDPVVRELLEMMNLRGAYITDNTAQEIADVIQEALNDGWDIDRTAGEVQKLFEDMKAYRARRIAVTSVTAAFERGQLESFRRGGVQFKRWLSERDARVRPTHQKGQGADGQQVPVGSPFQVGLAQLMYPGDPEGGAAFLGEIINCRCTMLPVNKRKQ